ncbi:hypothetical protein JRQ81_011547 [Phrynocephalus forsythii]|uniref:Uncharacterized protein n=1 Tax=Phrynocephalus forsythii TaxID=171643 RepID=A0A9Q0Y3F5_9SAUR|nr:hypothetical protein JRQ81_011547 [Phrynocephalus forsythii]
MLSFAYVQTNCDDSHRDMEHRNHLGLPKIHLPVLPFSVGPGHATTNQWDQEWSHSFMKQKHLRTEQEAKEQEGLSWKKQEWSEAKKRYGNMVEHGEVMKEIYEIRSKKGRPKLKAGAPV